jgi:hypothetical protein
MLNPYDHAEAERLAVGVADALQGIKALLARAADAEIPIIYVNDNYGDWNSSASELAEKAIEGAHPELVKPVLPPRWALFRDQGAPQHLLRDAA